MKKRYERAALVRAFFEASPCGKARRRATPTFHLLHHVLQACLSGALVRKARERSEWGFRIQDASCHSARVSIGPASAIHGTIRTTNGDPLPDPEALTLWT